MQFGTGTGDVPPLRGSRGKRGNVPGSGGGKERLDVLLVERGLAPSRERAKRCIMAGLVYVDGQKEDKAGSLFPREAVISVRGTELRYVSRGGLKLEKALSCFALSLEGKVCIDIGASTGGFTDCMLQNGASRVYAIDVGHGQLDWKLRNDERVVVMEKRNIRYVRPQDIGEAADFISIDVSFIGLRLVLPVAADLLSERGEMVCLIKPQFEAGREQVGKKGVVRDPDVHRSVIEGIIAFSEESGFSVRGLDYSPIRGPEGNIEYLLWLSKGGEAGKAGEKASKPGEGSADAGKDGGKAGGKGVDAGGKALKPGEGSADAGKDGGKAREKGVDAGGKASKPGEGNEDAGKDGGMAGEEASARVDSMVRRVVELSHAAL